VAADAAHGAGRCSPAALQGAFEHAAQWSMPAVAARYAALYERVVAGQRPER
jgi:hypothetical protein